MDTIEIFIIMTIHLDKMLHVYPGFIAVVGGLKNQEGLFQDQFFADKAEVDQ